MKGFKVTRQHLLIVLYVLGGSLILYGLLKILFKINLGPDVEKNFPTVVMVGAAVLFVWNRDMWKKEQAARDEKEAKKKAQDEAKALESTADPKTEAPKAEE